MKYKIELATSAITEMTMVANYGNYKVKGRMSARNIKSNVYEYHYDKSFTGEDAAGRNSNIQYA